MKHKWKRYSDVRDAARLLRDLADSLEGKDTETLPAFDDDLEKLTLKMQNSDRGLSIKLKYETRSAEGWSKSKTKSAVPSGNQNFNILKKRMKMDFQHIGDCVKEGVLPARERIDRFLADSAAMVSFSGRGDPHYDEYHRACQQLAHAFASADGGTLQTAYKTLKELRDRCHRDYK